jgi:serine/threonine protein kinase
MTTELDPGGEPIFPEVGESLGDFRLVAEIGRGGQGCVFLATQPALADRPVVLKITPCDGREHLSLARLQHTHIVPLYGVEDEPVRNLRLLCMPYFGSATLKHVLDGLRAVPLARRTGQHVLDVLSEIQREAPVQMPARGPARRALARASYVQALCRIGACLADALHYAHDRGLVHLDIKPSNVLLAVDGQPMLLDFHIAQEPLRPEDPAPEWLGGSPLYMSPEHKAAVAAARQGQRAPAVVDGRADLYSLGALLYGALGGSLPFRAGTSSPLHRCNPLVSVGLSDIIQKCLAPQAAARYSSAAAVAADLHRHLTNQRLHGVVNRSPAELWRKWRCRQPFAMPVFGSLFAVLVAAGVVAATWQTNLGRQRQQVGGLLERGQEQLRQGRLEEAASTLRHGLFLVQGLPQNQQVGQELSSLLHRVERAQAGQELTRLAGQVRFLFGIDFLPRPVLQELADRCRLFWNRRRLILDRLGPGLTPDEETQRLQADLLDLAILWTDLHVRLAAPEEVSAARREALGVLDQAEEMFGPSVVLYHERRHHAEALGLKEVVRVAEGRIGALPPRTAWEHYALGRSFLHGGHLPQAAEHFRQALALQPHGFWPSFYQGVCAYRLEEYLAAVMAFSVCLGAAPENAVCFHNRALALTALGRSEDAWSDYDHALRLDPTLVAAAVNRGLLHYRTDRFVEAEADFRRALDAGADPATVHYDLALVHLAQGDRTAALECLRKALAAQPSHPEAKRLQESLASGR